jgi:hypothetical protein
VINSVVKETKEMFNVKKWNLEQWGWGAILVMLVATAIKIIGDSI